MKSRFWSRLLIAFCGLMTLAFGAVLFSYGAGFFPFQLDLSALNIDFALWQRMVILVVALALVAVGAYGVTTLFRHNRDKGFIIQHTEYGDMSISMRALENMVKKCVESHQELTAGAARITRSRDGVVVALKVTMCGNANIPLTVNALQKQIKQYITSSSGVDVKEVRVMVETNASKLEAPEMPEYVADAPAGDKSPKAHSIFHHREEPEQYAAAAQPPEPAAEEPKEPAPQPENAEAPDDQPEDPPADEPNPDEPADTTDDETQRTEAQE